MFDRGSKLLKILDRYFGIPLIFILGLLKRKSVLPKQIQTIGLLKTAAIGDTVLLTAIIKDLRAQYPKAKIILYTGASNYNFAKLITDCDEVIKLPIKNIWKSRKLLRQYTFDIFLDFGAWPRINALYSFLSHSKFTVGFKTKGQYRHYIYDVVVDHSEHVHELENYRSILANLQMTTKHQPVIPVAPSSGASMEERYIVLHLSAGGEKSELKELPREKWLNILNQLSSEPICFLLTGSKEDKASNQALINNLNVAMRDRVKDISGCDISATIAYLRNAAAVLSVNTGIMHIAAALNVPTIGVHGPTSVKRWGPVGDKVFSVISKNPHAQHLNLGFEYQNINVMNEIDESEIVQITKKILN